MYGRYVVLVFQPVRYKGVCAFYAIYEVRSSLNHALVHQAAEWFVLAHLAHVEQEFVPEAGVYKVSHGVLGAAYVEVHVLPVGVGFCAHQCLAVVGVHVAQVVGR